MRSILERSLRSSLMTVRHTTISHVLVAHHNIGIGIAWAFRSSVVFCKGAGEGSAVIEGRSGN